MSVIKRKATHLHKFAKKRELALNKIQKLRRTERILEVVEDNLQRAEKEFGELKYEINYHKKELTRLKARSKYWEGKCEEVTKERVEIRKLLDEANNCIRSIREYHRKSVTPAFVPCYLVEGKMKVGQHYKSRAEAESAVEAMGHQYIGAYPVVADLFDRNNLIHLLIDIDEYARKIQCHRNAVERREEDAS